MRERNLAFEHEIAWVLGKRDKSTKSQDDSGHAVSGDFKRASFYSRMRLPLPLL